MEYFWSDGGNNKPYFTYRYTVKKSSLIEMMEWARDYPEKGPFSRYHVIFNSQPSNEDMPEIPLIQFELRDAYLAFRWAFAGDILEDKTLKEYRLD